MVKSQLERSLEGLGLDSNLGEIVLIQKYGGVVTRVADNKITVRYGSGDNIFELEYDLSQFRKESLPQRGDEITAQVILQRKTYEPKGVDHYLTKKEQQELDDHGKNVQSGAVEL